MLVESIWFPSFGSCRPAIFNTALGDQGEECVGEEESWRQLCPADWQLRCHVAWALMDESVQSFEVELRIILLR